MLLAFSFRRCWLGEHVIAVAQLNQDDTIRIQNGMQEDAQPVYEAQRAELQSV